MSVHSVIPVFGIEHVNLLVLLFCQYMYMYMHTVNPLKMASQLTMFCSSNSVQDLANFVRMPKWSCNTDYPTPPVSLYLVTNIGGNQNSLWYKYFHKWNRTIIIAVRSAKFKVRSFFVKETFQEIPHMVAVLTNHVYYVSWGVYMHTCRHTCRSSVHSIVASRQCVGSNLVPSPVV